MRYHGPNSHVTRGKLFRAWSGNLFANSLIERKSRMPQIQGVQGRRRCNLLRALGNEGDGVSPAFPKGKQNGEKKVLL